ncbi:MAG: serine/threonine protein phosphatase 1 [Rhodothermales bacterium]|jgi:serine/threonine protein phosphatase 1
MGLIAIGDIHGCPKTLDALLLELNPGSDDHLVFIGDYIDRGPDSKGVVDRLIELGKNQKCTFLRGNHEALLMGYLDAGETDIFVFNGGSTTLASYDMEIGALHFPDTHLSFFRNTKMYLETEDAVFVHAGLRPGLSVAENLERGDEMVFLWERSHIRCSNEELEWEKTVICGHTPVPRVINLPKLINLDTGCVFFRRTGLGRMTAVRWPEREFVSVIYAE